MEEEKPNPAVKPEELITVAGGSAPVGGGGWGGWGFSSFAVFSDIQKAAEEISRGAVEVAKSAAKGLSELQDAPSDSEASTENPPADVKGEEDEHDEMRKSALDRLEKASEDSLLGQGLKALDNSVESITSGAWHVLGNAWKGSSNFVQRLEDSAVNLADSIQQGNLPAKAGSLAPTIIETGKTFTAKGMQVLERVGKETMDLLISETGLELEKDPHETGQQIEEQFEEVTFDRCFYIYGGPEHLEELEALSNHYALLFNRKKAKLLSEQKLFYDGKLKQVQEILMLVTEFEESVDADKGKNIETTDEGNGNEMKVLRDSSVSRAADMAAGFAAALGGLSANEIIQKTTDRLETIHSEGVHRLSELCCFAVSQVLVLGKSVISNANKSQSEGLDDAVKMDWPEDSLSQAKIIRSKAQSMTGDVEAVSSGFITGISDIIEAYLAAIQGVAADAHCSSAQPASIQEKAHAISNHIRVGQSTALDKIQDGLQYLAYVVLSTSMASP
uniref:ATP phosphoribosyltransferase n=1 Tax=Anthurium amnicola TaxID=1678845 RepID=A0A1D1Y1Y4_9ARAE